MMRRPQRSIRPCRLFPYTTRCRSILGALLVHGVRTGPNLFNEQSSIVYTFMFGLLVATILMLPIGLLLGRYAFRTVIAVPKHVLVPMIALIIILEIGRTHV